MCRKSLAAVFAQIRDRAGSELAPASVFSSDVYSVPGLNALVLGYCSLLFPVRCSTGTSILGVSVPEPAVSAGAGGSGPGSEDPVRLFFDRLDTLRAALYAYTCPTHLECCAAAFVAPVPGMGSGSKRKRTAAGEEKGGGSGSAGGSVYAVNSMEFSQGLALLVNQAGIVQTRLRSYVTLSLQPGVSVSPADEGDFSLLLERHCTLTGLRAWYTLAMHAGCLRAGAEGGSGGEETREQEQQRGGVSHSSLVLELEEVFLGAVQLTAGLLQEYYPRPGMIPSLDSTSPGAEKPRLKNYRLGGLVPGRDRVSVHSLSHYCSRAEGMAQLLRAAVRQLHLSR